MRAFVVCFGSLIMASTALAAESRALTTTTVTTGVFSEENNGRGDCPMVNGFQTTLVGLSCQGQHCDNLEMTCATNGSLQVNPQVRTSGTFSEEHDYPFGKCPGDNWVITGISCAGDYCDNKILTCQQLSSDTVNTNSCALTSRFPSTLNQDGSAQIPAGSYSVAIYCYDDYCGSMAIRYCSSGGPSSGTPTPAPTPSPNAILTTSPSFSEENSGRGDCTVVNGLQTSLFGLSCRGKDCDNLQMSCFNDGLTTLDSAVSTSVSFDREDNQNGPTFCPGDNQVITGLGCEGQYCARMKLYCQKLLGDVKLDYGNCRSTAPYPSSNGIHGYGEIASTAYAAGMTCYGENCAFVSLHYCFTGGSGLLPSALPSQAPSSAPTIGPVTGTVGPFSDEPPTNTGVCPIVNGLQTVLKTFTCSGTNCDQVTLTCENRGAVQISDVFYESAKISDETGLGTCDIGTNEVVTGIRCQSTYCDNIYLECQKLTSVKLNYNSCAETPTFPATQSQSGFGTVPSGSYPIGIRCSGDYCAFKTIRYCFPDSTRRLGAPTKPF